MQHHQETQPSPHHAPALALLHRVRELRERGADAQHEEGQLLQRLFPMLNKEAGHWHNSRGALEHEDLVQVGALEALKLARDGRNDPAFFLHNAQRNARRAMAYLVGQHSRSVHPSDGKRRGLRGERAWACEVFSIDAEDAKFDPVSEQHVEREVAEKQLAKLVRDSLARMPELHREVVCKVHGMHGHEASSVRQVARELEVSRTVVTGILREAYAFARLAAEEGQLDS
jgi:DNA-directed RNA polymerase specialized sigma24 family protein